MATLNTALPTANANLVANVESAYQLAITLVSALERVNDELERDRYFLAADTINSAHFQTLRIDLRTDLAELIRLREHLFRIGLVARDTDGAVTYKARQDAEQNPDGLRLVDD